MRRRHFPFVLLGFLAVSMVPAFALEQPKGPVILTIKGNVSQPNRAGEADFDLAMLEALPGRSGRMETPWVKGMVAYSGPLLREVLKAAGASGRVLVVRALNDYKADVPVSDAETLETILATRQDGKLMPVRDKGPLMLVYPFDLDTKLFTEKYFARSVWQIREIEVLP
ncbi:molybdopterin-dependent oxidoreductase [Allorhizobium undicola]|uniref:molybdopterin-dependent oxidoreductase n=1 Tax=Allorhizobium undicola TaxID=78527 RepID=UPI003D34FDB7